MAGPMSASPGLRLCLAASVLAGALGCATARNDDDPLGPVIVGPQAAAPRGPGDLRAVTFNIKFAEHVDRAADLLSRPGPLADPDVLVVEEMDAPGTEALARALGLNYVFVPAAVHPASHRDMGVAILSPWALEDARRILLPHPHRTRKVRRSAAVATARTAGGPVRVYAVHLETPLGASGGARRGQARAILAVGVAGTRVGGPDRPDFRARPPTGVLL